MTSNNNLNNNVAWDQLSLKELYQHSRVEGVEGDEAQKHFHERIQSCSKRQLEELAEELIGAKNRHPGIQYSLGCIDSLVCGLVWKLSSMAQALSEHFPPNCFERAPVPFGLEEYHDRRGEISLQARNIDQVRVCDGKTLGHVLAAQGHISCLKDFVDQGGNLCVRDHEGMSPIDYLSLSDDPAKLRYCLGVYLMQRLNHEGTTTHLSEKEWGYFEYVSGSLSAETKEDVDYLDWIRKDLPPKFPLEMLEDALELVMGQHESAKINTLANLSLLIQSFGNTWKQGRKVLADSKNKGFDIHAEVLLKDIKSPAIRSCIWAISLLASEALDSVEEQQQVEDLKESLRDFLSTLPNSDLLEFTRSSWLTSARVRRYLLKFLAPDNLSRCQYTDGYSVKSFEHYESEIVNQAVLEKGWQSLVLTPEDGWENVVQEKKDKNAIFGSVLAHAIDRLDEEVSDKGDLRQVYSYFCAVRQVTEMLRGDPVAVQFGSSRMFEAKNLEVVTPISGPYADYLFEKILRTSDRNVTADFFVSLSLPNAASLKLTRVLFNGERKLMVHPRAEETMEILFDDAQADFAELMAGDFDEEEVWEKLAKVYWNLVQGMPCSRGNASICLALCSLVWRANGIEPPCLKPGIIPDLEAIFVNPPCRDSFIPRFKGFFDADV